MNARLSITPVQRRFFAVFLMDLGVVLMFFSPGTWAGLTFLVLGILIEGAGLVLGHPVTPRAAGRGEATTRAAASGRPPQQDQPAQPASGACPE